MAALPSPTLSNRHFKWLRKKLEDCRRADFFRLKRQLYSLKKNADKEKISAFEGRLEASITARTQRQKNLPKPSYPQSLPVSQRREEIIKAIDKHQVVIICGETGSGKTTQLPKMCLELGRGVEGYIGHTQPRRIAARSVAARLSDELQSELGQTVGYKIRFHDRLHDGSYIKLMTDGILLAEIQEDRYLNQYDTLIIDEAHERSLNIDFLLGYMKWLLPRRPELKLIITSATIDPERFSHHFDDAPIIEVSGRTYPVEIRYRPLQGEDEDQRDRDMIQVILDACDELHGEARGDILVFLAGEREIRETAEALRKHHPVGMEILPLYARLSAGEQNRVFQPHAGRRIVLSTNVAETSLTVPGIKYVVDTGMARISRYSWHARVQRLPIEAISQASANQRSGRCGRVSDGIAIRLYSEDDFQNRAEFTDPEILRTNLAAVILQMAQLRLGKVEAFPFVEAPDQRLIKDGFKLLFELGAVTESHRVTALGQRIARLPIDPRLGRMVLAAEEQGALREVLVMVSALSVQDPRERPMEKQQAADEQHARFRDKASDFIAYLKLWEYFQEQKKDLSQNKLRKLCRREFLSYMRLREWQDVHRQVRSVLLERNVKENQQSASYEAIHQSLLTGLLSQLGMKEDAKEYLGANGRKFFIFPASGLRKSQPKWIMAAELTETSRLFARTVGKIDPEWIESVAEHVIRRHYFEPHWEKKAARVIGFERLTLYGVTVIPQRKINYATIDPVVARDLFIRHALVYGEFRTSARFFKHNRELIESLETLEAKSRRRDILVDDEKLYHFYDERLPASVNDGRSFEKWRKQREREQPKLLFLTRDYLLQRDTDHIAKADYPDYMVVLDMHLPLSYHFEPGAEDDGVMVRVPAVALGQLKASMFDYLTPALLLEKITALIRGLPKRLRKNFVPAPDFARACHDAIEVSDKPLIEVLSRALLRMTGQKVPLEEWKVEALPDHLRMRYAVVDEQGKILRAGRDLATLKGKVRHKTKQSFSRLPTRPYEKSGLTTWDFGDLPESVQLDSAGMKLRVWPALRDCNDSVEIKLFDQKEVADREHYAGVCRLFILNLARDIKYLQKHIPDSRTLCLHYAPIGQCQALKEDIAYAVIQAVFMTQPLPRTQADFLTRLNHEKGKLQTSSNELCRLLQPIMTLHQQVNKHLKGRISPAWLDALNDVNDQLGHLVYRGFVRESEMTYLRHYPRYLKAVLRRLEKLADYPQKDRALRLQVQPHWQHYKEALKKPDKYNAENLKAYRWMIEEFRVSLFAQELGTAQPVSDKRLRRFWEKL